MKKVTRILILATGLLLSYTFTFGQAEVTPFLRTHEAVTSVGPQESMWDLLSYFNTFVGGEQGIGTDGVNYFTTKWSANAYVNRYTTAGVKIDSFLVGSVTGIRDLAFDGTYFYGGSNAAALRKMDFTAHTLVSTISTGVAAIRHCAYDPTANSGAGGFWVGGWADLALISMTGTVITTVPGITLAGMYGSAYDNFTPGGPYLWLFDQGAGAGTPQLLQQFSIPNLTLTGVTHDVADIPGYQGGTTSIAGGLEASSTVIPGKFVLMANVQQTPNLVGVYEIMTVGVNETDHRTVVTVFPNPARDYIKASSSIYPILNLSVVNYLGQTVYESTPNVVEARINTSDFEAGLYFVRVQTKDGISINKVTVQ